MSQPGCRAPKQSSPDWHQPDVHLLKMKNNVYMNPRNLWHCTNDEELLASITTSTGVCGGHRSWPGGVSGSPETKSSVAQSYLDAPRTQKRTHGRCSGICSQLTLHGMCHWFDDGSVPLLLGWYTMVMVVMWLIFSLWHTKGCLWY
jgi:hypothetical protein